MDTEKKQLELDKRYIRMASIWAENSYCQRRKVRFQRRTSMSS